MRLKWKLVSVRFEIVVILMQDRCTVCAKCTIGSEIILDTPDGTLGDVGYVESRFGPLGDSVTLNKDRCTVCAERTIASKIIWDAPDRTPR
jgi:hypothetical protein